MGMLSILVSLMMVVLLLVGSWLLLPLLLLMIRSSFLVDLSITIHHH